MKEHWKYKKATALMYDERDEAPIVKATGKGIIAEEIVKQAQEAEIPIVQDSSLAGMLAELSINDKIPSELYGVVAEVFAFIYQVDKNSKGKNS